MKKILIAFGVVCLFLAVTACGHKAETVNNTMPVSQKTQTDVEQDITLAARSLGWVVQPLDDQTMQASIKSTEYALTVLITYTPQSYVIQYKDSINLDFDPEDNSIDEQYTRWVEDLDERIQEEMERVK